AKNGEKNKILNGENSDIQKDRLKKKIAFNAIRSRRKLAIHFDGILACLNFRLTLAAGIRRC
ncbi:MAG: hypothetical protein LBT98_02955, partial [Puniceicoccales bacterium]|nr:hypothetical protein [Puniceicoccales bacterium]